MSLALPNKLPHSGTSIFTQMTQLAQQNGALNLSQGFPDFDSPPALLEALKHYASQGFQQYAPMQGLLSLREQIALDIQQRYGIWPDPAHEIAITPGATQAIFCAIQALVQAGDEVIIFDPCYDSYAPATQLAGGVGVHVPLQADFSIDWALFEAAISAKTRLVIINFPHNPSGAIISRAELERLAQIIADYPIFVLSDEVYEHLVFDGLHCASVLDVAALRSRAFMVGSFGKTFHVTGWKIGYVIAPPTLMNAFLKIHQYVSYCASTPLQYALAEFMQQHPEHIRQLGSFYQAKRDLFAQLMQGSGFKLLASRATYFQLLDYSALRPELDDVHMSRWLVEQQGIAVIPISVFYQQPLANQRLIRVCFAKTEQTLQQAAACLTAIQG
ncbi:MAG: aminotransferase class I/II-fold pyridoxal phosphate-dependent enzyme [Moraxellaceae bacterium]|nr:MAG: aminotransferase class I/II-fold pyridoxal phosphate-dependent enzyme [Moraxellaceae bacterium]